VAPPQAAASPSSLPAFWALGKRPEKRRPALRQHSMGDSDLQEGRQEYVPRTEDRGEGLRGCKAFLHRLRARLLADVRFFGSDEYQSASERGRVLSRGNMAAVNFFVRCTSRTSLPRKMWTSSAVAPTNGSRTREGLFRDLRLKCHGSMISFPTQLSIRTPSRR
jgi:hypothetical protein